MTTPYDVPASKLIEKLAKYLKDNVDAVSPPEWASVAKTGSHIEKQPQNPDWWYTRCASTLRKIHAHGPIGAEKLRSEYGGGKRKGGTPQHASKSGGSVVRKALQQLEAAGLIEKSGTRGRKVTKEGRKLLQELADGLNKELSKELPELAKYAQGE
ncbi:MAG TPA: 30S ribosomal protein S19e [Candidatus Bathyarchaeia archaeon]|nr:30S ribosomal protein S19e [Candidatus Bathyarchaeia archaeon]